MGEGVTARKRFKAARLGNSNIAAKMMTGHICYVAVELAIEYRRAKFPTLLQSARELEQTDCESPHRTFNPIAAPSSCLRRAPNVLACLYTNRFNSSLLLTYWGIGMM